MMSAKMTTLCLLKVSVFWNKGYDVIISAHDVTNKFLSHDSNFIIDVVMWPMFGNYHFYEQSYHNHNFIRIWPEKPVFFEGWSWFKFSNFKLALGTNLKFYISVAKGLKGNVRKFLGLVPTFVEVTREKLVRGSLFASPQSWKGLINMLWFWWYHKNWLLYTFLTLFRMGLFWAAHG